MATRLKNVVVNEISLVDRAAMRNPSNPDQPMKFLFWKNEGGAAINLNNMEVNKDVPISENVLNALTNALPAEMDAELTETLKKAGITDEATLNVLKSAATLLKSQKDVIEKARTSLSVYVDDMKDGELADILRAIVGFGKSENVTENVKKGDGPDVSKDGKTQQDSVAKNDTKDVTVASVEVDVKVDPEIQAMLQKAEEDNRNLAARLAKAEEALAKAEEERLTAQFIAKAESYQILGVDKTEFAETLKAIYKASPEAYAKLETFLNTLAEVTKKSDILMAEVGSSQASVGNSALDRLSGIAAELQKAEPKLTKEQAFAKAMENYPELYAEYVRERYGGDN